MTEEKQKEALKNYCSKWYMNSKWKQIAIIILIAIELSLMKIHNKIINGIVNIKCKIYEKDIRC